MKFVKSKVLEGVFEVFPNVLGDERGYFFESYNHEVFKQHGIDITFEQDNQSMSKANVLRGLHFQKAPYEQDKLIRVVQGGIMDVIVDIRRSSPTYGQHEKYIIDTQKQNMLLVPSGFAHGFLTLQDDTIVTYKCSNVYNKNSEMGLLWNDDDLNIDWGCEEPIISDKDKKQMRFRDFESPFN